jgi:hypothetical protein
MAVSIRRVVFPSDADESIVKDSSVEGPMVAKKVPVRKGRPGLIANGQKKGVATV